MHGGYALIESPANGALQAAKDGTGLGEDHRLRREVVQEGKGGVATTKRDRLHEVSVGREEKIEKKKCASLGRRQSQAPKPQACETTAICAADRFRRENLVPCSSVEGASTEFRGKSATRWKWEEEGKAETRPTCT
ncbi:hypothetical protein B0H19DRAFT_1062995 [Mycena capillaripes]|nr:hypothetical protein B0H19DRAFT_1062995 [Mycena capillaripes]